MNKSDSLRLAIYTLCVFGVMFILFSIIAFVMYFRGIPSNEVITASIIVISLMGILAILLKYDKLVNAPYYERAKRLINALEEAERRSKEGDNYDIEYESVSRKEIKDLFKER